MSEEGFMRRLLSVLVLGVLAAAVGTLIGCNDRLDDPTRSEGILTVESVDPVIVEADVTAFDPLGNPTPLTDDETVVKLKNRPRNSTAGEFSDILITRTEQACTFGGQTTISGSGIASFTIPSGSTADVTVVVITAGAKDPAFEGLTWSCYVQFIGEDVAGNPAQSDPAQFVISFVDK
jgi:hypothetical protein